MDPKISYWVELSDYDLETARAMLDTKRFLYVGFMCHQSIEKVLKAYWQKIKNEVPPKSHNLSLLASGISLLQELSEEQIDVLDELEPLNVEARYPEHKNALYARMDQGYCESLLIKTGDLQQWIKVRL